MLNLIEEVLTNEIATSISSLHSQPSVTTFIDTSIHEALCGRREDIKTEFKSDISSKGKLKIVEGVGTYYKSQLVRDDYKRRHVSFKSEVVEAVSALRTKLEVDGAEVAQFYIYDRFMSWGRPDMLQRCDDFIRIIMEDDYDVDTLLCVLMASFPMRRRLSYRSQLYSYAMDKASRYYGTIELQQLFAGLE